MKGGLNRELKQHNVMTFVMLMMFVLGVTMLLWVYPFSSVVEVVVVVMICVLVICLVLFLRYKLCKPIYREIVKHYKQDLIYMRFCDLYNSSSKNILFRQKINKIIIKLVLNNCFLDKILINKLIKDKENSVIYNIGELKSSYDYLGRKEKFLADKIMLNAFYGFILNEKPESRLIDFEVK